MRVQPNALFYGDNLDVLKKYFDDESVDLIYLDPPFNSQANYNVLFKEVTGLQSQAQLEAFTDSWIWDESAENAYLKLQERADNVANAIVSLVKLLSRNSLSAYLVMMSIRLVELHRVLKSTGSLYIHCDPTASHYLKIALDAIFGPKNFKNEIVWKRTSAPHRTGEDTRHLGKNHDVILFYSKSDDYVLKQLFTPYSEQYLKNFYRFVDEKGRRYRLDNLKAAGIRHGESGKPWHGVDPNKTGSHWQYTVQKLDELEKEGRIIFPKKIGGVPAYKRYLDEMGGVPLQDIWDDIPPVQAHSAQRLGYPTQKPEALLERIIKLSSNEGNVILDPFCGCGTAIIAASELKRNWFGIDITHLAIALIKSRLKDRNVYAKRDYQIIGEPNTFEDAKALAEYDKFQFEWWALTLVNAFPSKQSSENPLKGTKGADRGVDGWLTFREGTNPELERIVVQAKGGHDIKSGMVRDLAGTMESRGAKMGILITLYEPTEPMKQEAREHEYYESVTWGQKYPKIQIMTVEELLSGKQPLIPQTSGLRK